MTRSSLALADRRNQRAAVVGALEGARMSRSDIAEHFRVSPALITRLVRDLIDDGLLRELGTPLPSVGRPPVRLEVQRSYGALIAASCTAEGVRTRSTDLHGNLLREHHVAASRIAPAPEHLVDAIVELSERTPRLLGVGVGVPGVVDTETGSVSAAPDLGWTTAVPLYDMLRERLNVAVTVDNDVNLMMASERSSLPVPHEGNAVYLYLGAHGFGAGILSSGGVVRGAHGAAGEIGLVPLTRNTGSGKRDLEERLSGAAIAAKLARKGRDVTGPAIAGLVGLAHAGDAVAVKILDEFLSTLAHAISLIAAILDPAVVVLGGQSMQLGEEERSRVEALLNDRLPFRPQVAFARLPDDDAVLTSARERCWQHVLQEGI